VHPEANKTTNTAQNLRNLETNMAISFQVKVL
jgi:hypothetical protein